MDEIVSFLREYCYEELKKSGGEEPIEIDFRTLELELPEIAERLLVEPEETIPLFKEALKEIDIPEIENAPIHFKNLPDSAKVRIRNLRAKHLNKFICVEGIVKVASEVKPRTYKAIFMCPDCNELIEVEQAGSTIRNPEICPKCGRRSGFILQEKKMFDSRWLLLEEPFEIASGEKPGEVKTFLKEELTTPIMQRRTDPGNRIIVSGILKELPKKVHGREATQSDFYLEANHVEPTEETFEEIKISEDEETLIEELAKDRDLFKKLIASIAPSIYGYNEIKEGLLLQLFGGTPFEMPDGTKIRDLIHILLVGDPSTGKSQLLKLISNLALKSKYVSGKGVTGAGLVSTVRKDEFTGGWVLEAGALVLCNQGLLAIDEFDKVSKEDMVALHEAMEQGSYAYNFEILFANGKREKIGAFIDGLMEKYKDKVKKGIDCEILELERTGEKFRIFTTDFKGRIFGKNIKNVSRHKAEKRIFRIFLSNGRELEVSKDHPFFVLRNKNLSVIRAENLKKGDLLPSPKQPFFDSWKKKADPNLLKFIGYYLAEGCLGYNRGKPSEIVFSNSDEGIIKDYINCAKKAFRVDKFYIQKRRDTNTKNIRMIKKEVIRFLEKNSPEIFKKRLPSFVYNLDKKYVRYLVRALFNGDGHFYHSKNVARIVFSFGEKELAEDLQDLLLMKFGIFSKIRRDRNCFRLVVERKEEIEKYYELIGFDLKYKERVEDYLKNAKKSKIHSLPYGREIIKEICRILGKGERTFLGFEFSGKNKNISEATVCKFLRELKKYIENCRKEKDLRKLKKLLGITNREIAEELNKCHQTISYWILHAKENRREKLRKIAKIINKKIEEKLRKIEELVKNLELLVSYNWIEIKEIREERYDREWVYDIRVEPSEAFFGKGVILHNSVSIAKASIIATLPAHTSILAGANPKLGRFDLYRPIADQISVPPTILSRFDLKFVMKDVPNLERDEAMVDHVFKSRTDKEYAKPEIPTSLLRKYIAYAKQNITHIEISEAAWKMFKDFFLKQRSAYSEEDSIVPITFRQFEALLRLAQASAKIRLRDRVTEEDAERAIKIMKYSLMQLGFDPESKKIDIDRAESAMAASQRSKIRILLDIIDELEKEIGKEVPVDEIMRRAEEEGLKDAENLLFRLKKEGIIYEPKAGFIKKV